MDEASSVLSTYQACLLHSRADRILRSVVSHHLEEFDLTMNEWLLLGVLGDAPKTGLSLSSVAEVLDVSQPQITALMTDMVTRRYVKQKVSKKDRRSRFVMLTARGDRLLQQIEKSINGTFDIWSEVMAQPQFEEYIEIMSQIKSSRQAT